ncbi:redoxin domain-containing protein [Rhizobiales bacterium RZME27]|uniref:Redoxin domain-containing protein n=1 Tax=Endobacterium cereale TaxID=2663029 RepID=A0A6A8ABJ0_9HYPH|nr:redoxin domain-containing protein [Endobacterium cereale]MEB2848174.1 redoxin domain-containing protein [Endobacterium cereale]MQY46161.1 redoxin domain-containing protein [Endobacterium cereale]
MKIPAVGGGVIHLPSDLGGSYGVVLIYRGHWCPFCNEQVAAFVAASDALQEEGIKVVAFSVDDEDETKDFIAKHDIPFRMGHSADLEAIVAAVGAYQNNAPARGRFLENTGFVLAPDGSVVNAVYSSRAIGRLVPSDVIRLVAFMKSSKR